MRSVWVLLLVLSLFCGRAAQAEDLNLSTFGALPVLDDGRLKPLEHFARIYLQRFSGRETLDGKPALAWLATTLFDPAQAAEQKLFLIRSAPLRSSLHLTERPGHRYSLAELALGLEAQSATMESVMKKPQAQQTEDEQALVEINANVLTYNQLLQSLSLLLPLPQHLPDAQAETFLDAQKIEPELIEKLRHVLTPETQKNPDLLTPEQQQLASFVFMLKKLRDGGQGNQLMRIIPPQWGIKDSAWLSPWALVLSGQGSPDGAALLRGWQAMATAWRTGNAAEWQGATTSVAAQLESMMPESTTMTRLKVEQVYTRFPPFESAAFLYALTVVVAGFLWAKQKTSAWRIDVVVLTAAVLVHAAGIGVRMYILQRPPVGTLYESVLFVSLIGGVGALLLGGVTRSAGLSAGVASMALLLLMAAPIVQPDTESLGMLSAVLNTNFWLSTHVVCITIGYGVSLLASVMAHGLLATRGTRFEVKTAARALHIVSIVALLFTSVGTLLGGVWADQSWGRFWGWDPKENGALVIVLWIIWLLHARLAGQIGELLWAAGLAALSIVVALAWFGVNLLSVGLHSYGFISGIAGALAAFCVMEALMIAVLWKRASHAA